MANTTDNISKALRSLENEKDGLALYDDESIQASVSILNALKEQQEGVDSKEAKLMLQRYQMRVQEGVDIYIRTRFSKIVEMKEKIQGPFSQSIRRSFSPAESEFLSDYTKAVAAYKKEYGFDPTSPCRPPKGLNAEVTVIKGTGSDSICAGQQWMALKENEILTLRIEVAQELENMGYVRINEFLK